MNTARSAGSASTVVRLQPSPNVAEIIYCAWDRLRTTGASPKVVCSVNLFPTVKTRVARPSKAWLQVAVSARPASPVKVEFHRALLPQRHCCKRKPDVFEALYIRSTREVKDELGSVSFLPAVLKQGELFNGSRSAIERSDRYGAVSGIWIHWQGGHCHRSGERRRRGLRSGVGQGGAQVALFGRRAALVEKVGAECRKYTDKVIALSVDVGDETR